MSRLEFLPQLFVVLTVSLAGSASQAEETNVGLASFYSAVPASSGPLTAAHRHLPFGTLVRVTRTDTGNSVVVRINDRGPFVKGRIIDVSARAAGLLEMVDAGLARVQLEVIDGAASQVNASDLYGSCCATGLRDVPTAPLSRCGLTKWASDYLLFHGEYPDPEPIDTFAH